MIKGSNPTFSTGRKKMAEKEKKYYVETYLDKLKKM
jgi:hypothetical protein